MTHPYDSLTPDCVVDCIESIGLSSDLRLLALNSYENRVYQVGIEDAEPVIVKFYRAERWTDEQILEEHAFAQELVDHEISVVAPELISGETLHHVLGQRFSVFKRRGGYPPELDNLDHLYRLGQTLGRIHRVGGAADQAVEVRRAGAGGVRVPRHICAIRAFSHRIRVGVYDRLQVQVCVRSILRGQVRDRRAALRVTKLQHRRVRLLKGRAGG